MRRVLSRHRTAPARVWPHGLAGFVAGAATCALVLLGDWSGSGGALVQPFHTSTTSSSTGRPCVASSSTWPDGQTWHGCDPAVFAPSLPALPTTTPSSSAADTPEPAELPTDDPFSEETP